MFSRLVVWTATVNSRCKSVKTGSVTEPEDNRHDGWEPSHIDEHILCRSPVHSDPELRVYKPGEGESVREY